METKFSIRNVTRFYVPLLLQGFSQSLSYPLVAGIVAHGPLGVDGVTAQNQGLMIMFMIGALGGGLVTTGLVFAKTWFGYLTFKRLNWLMTIALIALQLITVMPPFDSWIFELFLKQPHELALVSRRILLWGVLMNLGFFMRNGPMVILFNRLESGKANNATFARIILTLAFSYFFPKYNLVGPDWGLFAMTVGVWLETLITWLYARPYVRELPNRPLPGVLTTAFSRREMTKLLVEQFRFTLPLSCGGFLLMCSPIIIAAFLGRTLNAQEMCTIHYATINAENPVAFAALRLQTVAVKFMPEYKGDKRLLWYALVVGVLFGFVPFAFSTDLIGGWFFGSFQNMPAHLIPTACTAMGIYSFICIILAVRARIEGIAAARKHPGAVMLGQIAYTLSLLLVCSILLPLGCPGWIIAVSGIFMAPICVTITIYLALAYYDRKIVCPD